MTTDKYVQLFTANKVSVYHAHTKANTIALHIYTVVYVGGSEYTEEIDGHGYTRSLPQYM